MKASLIFLHGDLTDLTHLPLDARQADLIIAADGGAEYAIQIGITPHILIGDMDSISPSTMKQLNHRTMIKRYPRKKDYTDAELAIQHALEQKATTIYIAGFLGRRLDHMIANLYYLSSLPAEIVLIEGSQKLFFIKKKAVITGKKGDEISLIPLKEDCIDISTEGLSYPLKGETLPYGTTRGVSNVMTGHKAVVTMSEGVLVCIHAVSIKE